jgi:hypothetical protein
MMGISIPAAETQSDTKEVKPKPIIRKNNKRKASGGC